MKQKLSGRLTALIVMLFAVFLVYGAYFNSFGANAQATMAFFGIDKTELGTILTVQAIGCIAVSVFLALYGERFNKLRGITLGLILMGIASLLTGTMTLYMQPGSGYALMLVYALIAGCGFIMIDLLMNGVIADIYPERKNTLLPFVHAMYVTGAMLVPNLVSAITNPAAAESFALPYRWLGAAALVVGLPLLVIGRRALSDTPYADMTEMRARAKSNPAEVFKIPQAWLFLLSGVFLLIFQNGMSAWLPGYCTEQLHFQSKLSGVILTVYFGGALIMRFLSPVIFKFMTVERFFLSTVLTSAVVFALCFFYARTETAMIAFVAVAGLLQGASVPSLVLLCCNAFPERTASASAIVVLAVSLSSFIGPVLISNLIVALGYQYALLAITLCLPISVSIAWRAVRPKTAKAA